MSYEIVTHPQDQEPDQPRDGAGDTQLEDAAEAK